MLRSLPTTIRFKKVTLLAVRQIVPQQARPRPRPSEEGVFLGGGLHGTAGAETGPSARGPAGCSCPRSGWEAGRAVPAAIQGFRFTGRDIGLSSARTPGTQHFSLPQASLASNPVYFTFDSFTCKWKCPGFKTRCVSKHTGVTGTLGLGARPPGKLSSKEKAANGPASSSLHREETQEWLHGDTAATVGHWVGGLTGHGDSPSV